MPNPLIVVLLLINPAPGNEQSTAIKPVYQHGRWGYADATGRIVIEPRFDAALPFEKGLARVGVVDEELPEIDGRPNILWGYINETGGVVVALKYNALRGFAEGLAACGVLDPTMSDASVFVRRGLGNFRWGYVDREGREAIPLKFFAAGDFSQGLAAVDAGGERDGSCGRNHKYGYVDKTGTFIINPRFAYASAFKNGSAQVAIGHTTYQGRCVCCAPRFVGRSGVINLKGEFVDDGKSTADDSFLDPDSRELPR
jgi:hypothetical protein